MNTRIKILRDSLGLSRASFGEQLGISGDAVNNMERGRADIKEDRIKLICSVFSVNEKWLRTGEGEMFNFIEDEVAAIVSDMLENGDQDPFYQLILSTVRIYQKYDDKGKEVFKSFAIQLIEEMKKRDD